MKVSENRHFLAKFMMQCWQYLTFFSTFHLACKEVSFRIGVFSTMSELYVL